MIKLNYKEVEFESYPNGETRPIIGELPVRQKGFQNYEVRYESDADLFNLMLLKRHMDVVGPSTGSVLFLSHMPYARMDRVENPGEQAFTLKTVCDLINWLSFDNVLVADPHSDVCVALLNNCMVVSAISPLLDRALKAIGDTATLVFPDAGAQKKYERLLGVGEDYFFAIKHRDFEKGTIESINVHYSDPHVVADSARPGVAVIVDDLCSRGGTFVGTAEALKRDWGFDKVYLVVAHCEPAAYSNSKLYDEIEHVYTTDSMPWPGGPRAPGFTRFDQTELLQEIKHA